MDIRKKRKRKGELNMDILFTVNFIYKHWKEGAHLLFRTKRFGVNGEWHSDFDSIFGLPNKKIFISILKIKPIYENYKMIKFRAAGCHFLSEETNKKIGWYKYWMKGKKSEV